MNICFVLIEYPINLYNGVKTKDLSGGIGTIMYDIAHKLKKRGHNIIVVTRSNILEKDYYFSDNGIEVYKFYAKNHLELTCKITKFLKEVFQDKIDIIETCDYAPMINEYIGNIPILLRLHISYAFLEYCAGKIISPYQIDDINRLHYSYSLHLADSIAGVSKYILENQVKFHGFPKEKIYGVIYNGISNLNKTFPFDNSMCFCHGTVSKRKGTHLLCNIFNIIFQQRPFAHLKIIGSGKSYWNEHCKPLLAKNAIKNVTFIDYQNRNNVLKEISRAGIYLSMSSLEAMSMSMLEAMSLGKPLILLQNGSFEEFIDNEIEGYIVSDINEAANRAIELIDDANLYARLSKAAKEKAERFSLNKCILETEKWYVNVLKNKNEILSNRNHCFSSLLKEYYKYSLSKLEKPKF